jgi:hypothetical protein
MLTCKQCEKKLVKGVTSLKRLTLGAMHTLSDDDAAGIVPTGGEQSWQIRRPVFPIAVHHEYALEICPASDFHQTDGDRPLVAQIKPKAEYLDLATRVRAQSRIAKLIRKSTNATTTVAVGTISRGKYTLLIRLALLIRLLEASPNPVAKNVHGSMPANTISG